MKGILIAISGTIILTSSMVYGQAEAPVIDQRQVNQEDWIERSFDRGQFNHREAAQLDREQDRTDRGEHREKTDRVVTRKDPARIGAAQKRTSRPIVRERHNHRDAQHR